MENSVILTKVREYKGNNGFILSLKGGLTKYGSLTPKQLSAADNFFSKFDQPKTETPMEPKNVNVDIKVTKFIAKKIAEDNELEFNPYLMTISKVLKETPKAYQVVGKMTTSDVSSCRCCGKDLTDWRSQATGVGPVCSKSLGIPYVKKEEDVEVFKKLLKIKIDKIGDLTFWLAKSQIVEGSSELKEQLS
jgi:hypothetical protein